jgi:hypothetical protein
LSSAAGAKIIDFSPALNVYTFTYIHRKKILNMLETCYLLKIYEQAEIIYFPLTRRIRKQPWRRKTFFFRRKNENHATTLHYDIIDCRTMTFFFCRWQQEKRTKNRRKNKKNKHK